MERLGDFLHLFYRMSLIPVHCYREEHCIYSHGPSDFPYDLAWLILQNDLEKEEKHIIKIYHNAYYGLVQTKTGDIITVGPALVDTFPADCYAKVLREHQISLNYLSAFQKYMKSIPIMKGSQIRAAINMIATASDSYEGSPLSLVSDDPVYSPEPADLRRLNPEHALIRHDTEQLERQVMTAVRFGKDEELLAIFGNMMKGDFSFGSFNLSSVHNAQKALIAFSAILSRVAYAAGLSYDDALTIQDYYLERSELAKTPGDITLLIGAVFFDYCSHIKKLQSLSSSNLIVIKVCNDITQHLYSNIKVAEIAARLGYTVPYLSAAFSKETGVTIKQYILREKIREAEYLLIKGDPIAMVSEKLCFSSIAHFQTSFRNITGTTPGDYVKEQKRIAYIP